jgi:hypothetical protein
MELSREESRQMKKLTKPVYAITDILENDRPGSFPAV